MKFILSYFKVVLTSLLILLPLNLKAMEFNVVSMDGRDVLSVSGAIESGDAERYRSALLLTPVQPHGARVVLLDSPGGSVDEALAMSDINDDFIVHMFIGDGAECASACASILFISGDYRTMSPNGLFGQHSCSRGGVPDEACNEQMATHAFEHGVAHGAVKAFVSYVLPDDILWFNNTTLDCWGITYYPFSKQSGLERIDPCLIDRLYGRKPEGQSVWRIAMKADGYRAFARPISDDTREFELSLYCDETEPGQLYLDIDISGPEEVVRSALKTGYLVLGANDSVSVPYQMQQVDSGYTRVTMSLPLELT